MALPGLQALSLAPGLGPGGLLGLTPQIDPSLPRVKELRPGSELRLIVADDKHARIKVLGSGPSGPRPGETAVRTSAEIFGAELVPGQEYPLLGGTRTALYSWHGCSVQISGHTEQEYDAPNVVMREYLHAAAIIEQKRQRALELDLPAPRVLVCGSAFSGKSSLCQILCNYSQKRERTPIFVELDTRYSSIRQLQGLPACVSACPIEHTADEEPQRRMAYFYGNIDWSEHPKLYENTVSHLSRVVLAKLQHATSPDAHRIAASGLIINAPFQPTSELLIRIVELFQVDVILVLDNESMHAAMSKAYANCPRVHGIPKVEVVPLPKAGGVVQATAQRLRYLRALRVRDYFYGVMRDFHPYTVLVQLSDVQLVQVETTTISAGMLPHGQQQEAKRIEFVPRAWNGKTQQLEHALLAVVRANSMSEVLYGPMLGLVLVTGVEEDALQLLCPAPPPLPSSYLLVGDFKNLKFIDI